jgi:hypothetical protein
MGKILTIETFVGNSRPHEAPPEPRPNYGRLGPENGKVEANKRASGQLPFLKPSFNNLFRATKSIHLVTWGRADLSPPS